MISTQLHTEGPKILITNVQSLAARDSCALHYNVRGSGGKTPCILNLGRSVLAETHPRYMGYSEAGWADAVTVIIQDRRSVLTGGKKYKRTRTHA